MSLKITTFQKSVLGSIKATINTFYETVDYFRKKGYVFNCSNGILGPNHSYIKWTIHGPFGTEHVKARSRHRYPVICGMLNPSSLTLSLEGRIFLSAPHTQDIF